jgi:hypothetical protein
MPNFPRRSATKSRFDTSRLEGEIAAAALVRLEPVRRVQPRPPLTPEERNEESRLASVSLGRSREIITAAFRAPCPAGCAPALAWCYAHVKGVCGTRLDAAREALFPLDALPSNSPAPPGSLEFRHVNRQQRGRS